MKEVREILVIRRIKAVFDYMKHPGNRGRRLSFMARYLAWQVRKRSTSRPKVVEFYDGLRINAYGDCPVSALVVYCGLFEYDEMLFVSRYLAPGECFVDVGANIGVFTLIAAKKVGSSGRVFPFEPFPEARERLKANLALNRFEWIEVQEKSVGDFDGEVPFVMGVDLSTGHLATSLHHEEVKAGPDEVLVPICRLDTFFTEKQCPSVALVKADIEGAELYMLKGAAQTLQNKKVDVWLLEANKNCRRFGYPRSEMFDLLRDYGYSLCIYDADANRLEPLSELAEFYENIWAVKDISAAQSRLERSSEKAPLSAP